MKITHILLLILYVGLAAIFTACKPSVDNIQVTDAPQYPVIANEISNQQVNAFAEDAQGHIWIGTFRGLNKYDAYEFQQYYCTDDSLGPQDNQIKALLRDSKGQLWVSSVNGLSVYTDQDTFRHIPSDLINRNGLQLLETRDGRILLNTVTSLGVYNPVTGRLEYAIRRLVPSGTYAAQCHIDADNRKKIRETYESCRHGKFDYCYAFIERSIKLLNVSGKLVQLVPSNIYKNVFGKKLRELLYPHISLIREYPGQELFDGTLTSSTVFLYDKAYNSEVVTYIDMTVAKKTDIIRSTLGDKWIFSQRTESPQEQLRFGDYFHASIVVATLFNKAFVLSEKDLQDTKIEAQVLRKAASPKQLRRKVQEYIIFPYYYKNKKLMRYDRITFERDYPNAVHHLNIYKTELDKRQKDDQAEWFEYGRSQALAHLKQEKLLMSTVVTKQVELYILDEETVPYSGIFITVKNSEFTLDDAVKILQNQHFMDYVQSLGISVSGNSKRITCKDINNYMFVKE